MRNYVQSSRKRHCRCNTDSDPWALQNFAGTTRRPRITAADCASPAAAGAVSSAKRWDDLLLLLLQVLVRARSPIPPPQRRHQNMGPHRVHISPTASAHTRRRMSDRLNSKEDYIARYADSSRVLIRVVIVIVICDPSGIVLCRHINLPLRKL